MILHEIDPVYNSESRILILGSFPSVRSRAEGFFYGHPQNRFWKVLAAVRNTDVPETTEEKKRFLLSQHIALWDVLAACEITGSADSTIKKETPNDLSAILNACPIRAIFTNGKTAERLFDRYDQTIPQPKHCLPSTSPANARFSLERLTEEWMQINAFLRDPHDL